MVIYLLIVLALVIKMYHGCLSDFISFVAPLTRQRISNLCANLICVRLDARVSSELDIDFKGAKAQNVNTVKMHKVQLRR